MGRCKDCRCFIVQCFRGDRCKRCVRVTEEEKREMAELEVRLVEEQLATRREMQMTALEQSFLEAEVQQTAEETRRETEMTFLESIRRNEQMESEITNTVRCLREWGFTCEQALEYVRLISEENTYTGKTYNGEGWTEVARYLQQFGMTSEQAEQCRELSEDRKREYVGEGNHELLYDSISNAVIADATSKKGSTTRPHNDTESTTRPHNDTESTTRPHNDTESTTRPHNDTESTARPHNDTESTYECYADGSNGIHSCISAGQGSLCQQIMRQLQLGKSCAPNGKCKSSENVENTERCNDVTMEIKDDKSIEAFQSAPDVDNDPDVDKDPNVDNEGNTIFEEEGSNVSHGASIKEESMEAQDESTPNTKDGSIDDSSAIFEEEITNNGDFGHQEPSKTRRRMTILYLRQWGFTSEEVAEYLRQTQGVSHQ